MGDPRGTASTGVATATRSVAGSARGTGQRPSSPAVTAPRQPFDFRISPHPSFPNTYYIDLSDIRDESTVLALLFKDGKLPAGFRLAQDNYSIVRWRLTIPPGAAADPERLSKLSQRLLEAVIASKILGLTPEETAAHRERAEAQRSVQLDFLGREFQGVTIGQVLDNWPSQWWETPEYFVYLGYDPAFTSRIFVYCRRSKTSKEFDRDIRYYLNGGVGMDGLQHTSLRDAIETFQRDTMERTNQILAAYAIFMASAAGQPGFPGPPPFGLTLESAMEVIGTAVNVYLAWEGLPPLVEAQDKDEEEFQADVYQAAQHALHLLPNAKGQVKRGVLGQLGEHIARYILEHRGYKILVLQNKSGHGLDIVAIKDSKNPKLKPIVLFGEVKSSEVGQHRLSKAQQKSEMYIVSRLERAAQLYNLTPALQQETRALLARIHAGELVVSTGAKFFATVDWATGDLKWEVKLWKTSPHPASKRVGTKPGIKP